MVILLLNICYLSKASVDEVSVLLKDADIVCLNEVDNRTPRSGYVNQARSLANACDMYYRYGKSWTFQDGSSTGNAILSKQPFVYSRNILLPYVEGLQRSVLVAGIGTLRVICTHLNGGPLRNAERIKHINQINQYLSKGVVCGDFNHTYDRDSAKHALTLWKNSGPDTGRDYIYTKGMTANAQIIESNLSDHNPVLAEIT